MAEPDPPRTPADFNPYAPPAAPLGEARPVASGALTEAEAVRRRYLGHEASVKSIGSLHYLAVVLSVFGAFVASFPSGPGPGSSFVTRLGLPLALLALIVSHVALGVGLTRLQAWARWVEATLVGLFFIGLLAGVSRGLLYAVENRPQDFLPVLLIWGTFGLILGYVLYLLLSKKATVVFSREYRDVIAQTPHIKYHTSCLVWFLVILIVAVGAIAMLGFSVRFRR